MDKENRFWLAIWALIAGTIVTIALLAFLFTYLGQRDLLKAGFAREVLPSTSTPQWVKR